MPSRKFTVLHLGVDAFPQGSTFDEAEFRRLNPAPPGTADLDAHYAASFDRLLSLGAVKEVPDSTPADETPIGPMNPTKPAVLAKPEEVPSASGGKSEPEPRKGVAAKDGK